jgi:hypothetical protein
LRTLLIIIFLLSAICVDAQRQYTASSVLSQGNWYKIAVNQEGIYKVDVPFLASLGINSSNLSSASIKLFGNGGGMLPENNLVGRQDDLAENSIQVFDGGDGVFNGQDYFLFYAPGAHQWQKDSAKQSFKHQQNIYSNQSFYFISIGGTGKRIISSTSNLQPNVVVNAYDEHIFHELDTINFLKSGREWYGEEFSNTPGNLVNRSFTYNVPNLQSPLPVIVTSNLAARSVGAASRFDVRLNGQILPAFTIPAVSGNFLDAFAVQVEQQSQTSISQNTLTLNYSFSPGTFNAQGWLNWFEIFYRANLSINNASSITFRDWQSTRVGNVAQFVLQGATANTQVWDVTNIHDVTKMTGSLTGTNFQFVNEASRLHEYVAFNETAYLTPTAIGLIPNQNLHSAPLADYIIVTHSSLLQQANRLAQFHTQHDNLKTFVATTDQVFNEFSSGVPDPTAIRDFVKMFYDRAGADTSKRPKYLLLFGDASFDYKNRITNNTNLVPCYESPNSLDPLTSYTSDDFFGLLDDGDDINLTSPPSLLDIGVGRIPAATPDAAKVMVDKIIRYHSPSSFGPWRNQLTFVADDEDANLHLQDAESITSTVSNTNPVFNATKIYLDAYRQESGSGGSRYPAVNQAIVNQMFNGNLIWNYDGHGGSNRLAEEDILDHEMLSQFNNPDKLPLFITATCDFAPYDDPTQTSLGEDLLIESEKGAIALTTTTRLVFAYSNRILNNNYLQFALKPNAYGAYLTLGEALRQAKNFTYNSSSDINNNRKFTLLGDPAMKLAYPDWKVQLNTINGHAASVADTLTALNKYTITGQVTDALGNPLNNFNGSVYPSVYDKAQPVQTLANDPGSQVTTFSQQNNIIYKGKASVSSGQFSFSFIVPKDISYQGGNGRMSFYAENGTKDANGVFTNFAVGGAGNISTSDKEGPSIKAYLNDEKFVNGGLANEKPILLLKLADSSGINTVGTGIGHDITAIIDGNEKNILVLNDFYEAALDNYQQGTVRFQLPVLEPGPHSIKIKAWDVANNSNELILEFVVASSEKLELSHVYNYPNPFTTKTNFWFEFNQPSRSFFVLIQLYSVSGKLVHEIRRVIQTDGNRSTEIEWDGRDAYNNRLARGVYIYKLTVKGMDGKKAEKIEKLYLL